MTRSQKLVLVAVLLGGTTLTLTTGLSARDAPRIDLASAPRTQEPNVKGLYKEHCKDCHGVVGAPTKESLRKYEKIADFTKGESLQGKTDKELVDAVANGKGRDMKGFKDKLSAAEIAALVQFVRTLVRK